MSAVNEARLKYKPEKVEYLLIAEAPPNSLDRFFYFEDVRNKDFLFIGIMEVLYPQMKERYLLSGRKTELKRQMLEQFKSDGFYLIDLIDEPKDKGTTFIELTRLLPGLLRKLDEVVEAETKIVIIKASVFDIVFPTANAKYKSQVSNSKLPFPSSGQQANFRSQFTDVVKNFLKFS